MGGGSAEPTAEIFHIARYRALGASPARGRTLKHRDPRRLACADQIVIKRGERQAAPQGQLQIGRIVGGQPVSERKAVHIAEHSCRALCIGGDPQRLQLGNEVLCLWPGESAPVLLARQHGARLIKPQHRHHGVLARRQSLQDAVGIGMGRALETPSHSDGIIENKAHARP